MIKHSPENPTVPLDLPPARPSKARPATWRVLLIGIGWGLAAGLAPTFLWTYGWSLFVVLPIALGASVAFASPRTAATGTVVSATLLAILVGGVALTLTALEGAICIVMAMPLFAGLAILGARLALSARRRATIPSGAQVAALVVLPALMAGEAQLDLEPAERSVTSAVIIDAPPEEVWRNVVAFPRLPPPNELHFRAGIAYPIEATIEGRGVGAIRRCRFSTGDFVEPITVWEEPRLLRFEVTEQPAPMRELTPYGTADPPHLHGFLDSRAGQFRLTRLPGGRTRLEGTTWYTNEMWPAAYWGAWSDRLIASIHMRVLRHIERVSEHASAPS